MADEMEMTMDYDNDLTLNPCRRDNHSQQNITAYCNKNATGHVLYFRSWGHTRFTVHKLTKMHMQGHSVNGRRVNYAKRVHAANVIHNRNSDHTQMYGPDHGQLPN